MAHPCLLWVEVTPLPEVFEKYFKEHLTDSVHTGFSEFSEGELYGLQLQSALVLCVTHSAQVQDCVTS